MTLVQRVQLFVSSSDRLSGMGKNSRTPGIRWIRIPGVLISSTFPQAAIPLKPLDYAGYWVLSGACISYFRNPFTICASASSSVSPRVISFTICSPAIFPIAAS